MPEIAYGFKAIKPITAEHPPESGIEVTYQPGDEVPAHEWKGAAVDALIENGKIMRYATNVYGPDEIGGEALPVGRVAVADDRSELLARVAELEAQVAALSGGDPSGDGPFPRGEAGGWFVLSNGERVRGKQKALAAQAALDVSAEAG